MESLWDSKFRAEPETADGRIGNSSAAPFACLIKNFVEYDPDRVTFNEDIHATAIGYEAWARHDLEKAKLKAGGQA